MDNNKQHLIRKVCARKEHYCFMKRNNGLGPISALITHKVGLVADVRRGSSKYIYTLSILSMLHILGKDVKGD